MATQLSQPFVSVAHPLHRILTAYPIACFSGAFVTDIVYLNTAVIMWADFSVWLITAGLVMGIAAVVIGTVEAFSLRDSYTFPPAWLPLIGNVLVLALSLWNAFVHSRDAWTSVVPTGVILSGIVTVLVVVVNWWGTIHSMPKLTGHVR